MRKLMSFDHKDAVIMIYYSTTMPKRVHDVIVNFLLKAFTANNKIFLLKSLQRLEHAVKATTIHDTQKNVDFSLLGSQPKQTKLNSFKLNYYIK